LREQAQLADQSIENTKGRLTMTMTRTVIDGVEFFVNIKTGEVGISISGLARLCGVTEVLLQQLLDDLDALIEQGKIGNFQGLFWGTDPDFLWETLELERLEDMGPYYVGLVENNDMIVVNELACSAVCFILAFHAADLAPKAKAILPRQLAIGLRYWVYELIGYQPIAPTPKFTRLFKSRHDSPLQILPKSPPEDAQRISPIQNSEIN
jgi:hypothetical protein